MIDLFPIPKHWGKTNLGDICQIRGGVPAPQDDSAFVNGEIPFVRMKDVGRYHITNNLCYTEQSLNRTFYEEKCYQITPRGSILLPRSGSVGLNHRAILTVDAVIVSHLCAVTPTSDQILINFLFHYLCMVNMQMLTKKTTGLDSIAFSDLSEISIPMPPLDEQQRITEILDKAEDLRAKRRAALAQLNTLIQSVFLEMFGNPATNPKRWNKNFLKDLCEEVIDCPHSTPKYANHPTPYFCIRSSDIQNDQLDLSATNCVEKIEYKTRIARGKPTIGDIVYCREGARFGNAARIIDNSEICLGQRMMLFRPKKSESTTEFIWAYLSSAYGYNQAKRLVDGSASPHINIKDIVLFSIPTPPIDLQNEFACRVKVIDEIKKLEKTFSERFDELFASLQYRSFRGELKYEYQNPRTNF